MQIGVDIFNYKLLRTDSNTCAGGVSFYIKDTIKFRIRKALLLKLKRCEDLWLEVECKGSNLIVAEYIVTQIKTCFLFRISFAKI